jgi:hypothetical protein
VIVAVTQALCGAVLLGGCAGDASGTVPTNPQPSASPSAAVQTAPNPSTPVQTAPSLAGDPMASRFPAATARIGSLPGTMAIIVHDRNTGKYWRAGATNELNWTGSTIKLALVTSLLERARAGQITLDGAARQQMADMLNFSSDDAATTIWNRYGKDTMVPRFQQVYGMPKLTFIPGFARFWGHMKCTTEDLMGLISYVLDRLDQSDRDYIINGMTHVGPIQQWGVWAAGPAQQPGTKNGWSIEPDPGGKHWETNTFGFAGPQHRYTVAVMYHLPPGPGIDVGVHAVSDLIANLFGARTPAQVTVPDPSTGL